MKNQTQPFVYFGVESVIRSSHVSIGIFLFFFLYCEALNKRNVIHYSSGKLANVKETLNGIERVWILFHGSLGIKNSSSGKRSRPGISSSRFNRFWSLNLWTWTSAPIPQLHVSPKKSTKTIICGNFSESIWCLHEKITLAHPIKQFFVIVDLSLHHLHALSRVPSKCSV